METKVFSIEITKEEMESYILAFNQLGKQVGRIAIDIPGFVVMNKIAEQLAKFKEGASWN